MAFLVASLVGVTNRVLVIDLSKILYVLLSRNVSFSNLDLRVAKAWIDEDREYSSFFFSSFVAPAASHLVCELEFVFLLDS